MSLSDIWGATDKEFDPDAIEVPIDPKEAFEAGLRWGVEHNLNIVEKWAESIPGATSALDLVKHLQVSMGDLSSMLRHDVGYWANMSNLHRSDELARVARICENDMKKEKKVYADD